MLQIGEKLCIIYIIINWRYLMTQVVSTFSVSEDDKPNLELVKHYKEKSKHTGISFTYFCLKALHELREREVINGQK